MLRQHNADATALTLVRVSEREGAGRPEDLLVMVVSAWHDDDGVRARVIHNAGGPRNTVTCRSLLHLLGTVESLITSWDDQATVSERPLWSRRPILRRLWRCVAMAGKCLHHPDRQRPTHASESES